MRRDYKITQDGNSRLRYKINGQEVTPAIFMADMYDEHTAMPSNANISLTGAQLASLAATSSELGTETARVYSNHQRMTAVVAAVKASLSISTKAV